MTWNPFVDDKEELTWLSGVGMIRPTAVASISADKLIAGAVTADKLVIDPSKFVYKPETSLPPVVWKELEPVLTREKIEETFSSLYEPTFDAFTRYQIQVWVEDRLVGYLEGDLRTGHSKVAEFRDDYGIMRPVKVREAELSRFELLSRDDEVRAIAEFCEKKHVGADFQRIDSHHRGAILFRWNTIEVCLAEYEEMIFDLDSFDPA